MLYIIIMLPSAKAQVRLRLLKLVLLHCLLHFRFNANFNVLELGSEVSRFQARGLAMGVLSLSWWVLGFRLAQADLCANP